VKFIGQKIKYMGEVHFQTTTQLIMSPKLLIVTMSSQTTKKSCQCSQMNKNTFNKIKTDTKNQEKKKKKLGVADSKKSNYLTDVQVL
jgi:hypothetical protein